MKKSVVGSIILVLVTCGWGSMSVGEQRPALRGELRVVDTDPQNFAWIAWNIFDHLVEIDKDGKLVPRLATAWQWLDDQTLEMTLRQLDPTVYNRKTRLPDLDQPAEQQAWDIALTAWRDPANFPVIHPYHVFALDGPHDWVLEEPELPRLYAQVLRTVDREHQQALIRQMERHTRDQAYFLFLYNPIKLYAVNKAVDFVPYMSTTLSLAETSVMEEHWSVRKQKATVPE